MLSFAHLCADINSGALPALLPFLVLAFGYDYTDTAVIMFGYAMVASLVQPVLGYFSDRWSRVWFIPLGIILVSSGIGVLGFMPGYRSIVAAVVVSGFGSALFHPEAACYANFLAGDHKATGMSFFAIGGNGGFVLGPLVVGLVIPCFGLHGTLLFAFLGAAAAGLFLCSFSRLPSAQKQQMASARHAEGENDWKAFSLLTGVVVSRSILSQGFYGFVALYWMHVFGVSAATGSLVLAFFSVTGVFSNLTGGILSDRAGYIRIIRFTQILLLPAVFCFALAGNPWLAGLLLFVIAFCLDASFSPMVILGQTYLARSLGFAAGVTMGISRSAGGIAMPLIGLIADRYGLPTAFLCLTTVAVAGLVSSWFLKKTVYD